MVGPLMVANGDPRAPTINIKNVDGGPLGVSELVIREHPSSTLRNVDGGPSWEVLTEIR
jgi:hypothetical protein